MHRCRNPEPYGQRPTPRAANEDRQWQKLPPQNSVQRPENPCDRYDGVRPDDSSSKPPAPASPAHTLRSPPDRAPRLDHSHPQPHGWLQTPAASRDNDHRSEHPAAYGSTGYQPLRVDHSCARRPPPSGGCSTPDRNPTP